MPTITPIFVITSEEGYDILVDEDSYKQYHNLKWRISTKGYATATKDGKPIALHREIMGITDPKAIVDHQNNDRLDYRRANLRVVTLKQNNRNRQKNWNSQYPYKGIQKLSGRRRKPWNARIMIDGQSVSLGVFSTPEEAAIAYDAKAVEVFGEFANLNFPKE